MQHDDQYVRDFVNRVRAQHTVGEGAYDPSRYLAPQLCEPGDIRDWRAIALDEAYDAEARERRGEPVDPDTLQWYAGQPGFDADPDEAGDMPWPLIIGALVLIAVFLASQGGM
jgi:hypothetical protein